MFRPGLMLYSFLSAFGRDRGGRSKGMDPDGDAMTRSFRTIVPMLAVLALWGCAQDGLLMGVCGDGVLDPSEACDDGNTANGDGCSAVCVREEPPTSVCGNGVLEPPETCDDGNTANGDGCSAVCAVESDPGVLPTLASIQRKIFTPICSACHFPQGTGGFMPLHTEDVSYRNLVRVQSFLCSGLLVDPGNPDNSCLVLKLEGSNQAGGDRMPSGGRPPLSEEEIGAIREWISLGAPR